MVIDASFSMESSLKIKHENPTPKEETYGNLDNYGKDGTDVNESNLFSKKTNRGPTEHKENVQFGKDGTETYTGSMMKDEQENWIQQGQGKQIYPERHEFQSYEGNWDLGKFNGEGELQYSNGRVYVGEFSDGIP